MSWRGIAGGLFLAAALGCDAGPSVDPSSGDVARVLGVMRVQPRLDPDSGVVESCELEDTGAVVSSLIVFDTLRWTELELPMIVLNNGPHGEPGRPHFDDTLTPTGFATAYWTCAVTPATPSPIMVSTSGDGGFDASLIQEPDGGGDGSVEIEPFNPGPIELVLHRRDPLSAFCQLETIPEPVDETDAALVAAEGARILGGQLGRIDVAAIPPELAMDVDFELQLSKLARSCCGEVQVDRCEHPLDTPACDALSEALAPFVTGSPSLLSRGPDGVFERLVVRLASLPSTIWMQLNLGFGLRDPYGHDYSAKFSLRLGFCRGCGSLSPREGGRPEAVVECLARRLWE